MVAESATILKRLLFLERELVLLQAGWLPAVAHWELKLLLPELLWESSVFVRELRQRILELRYPERRIAVDDDGALLGLFRRFGNAPHALAFGCALAEAIGPFLLGLHERYRQLADELDDAPTQFFLRHRLADLRSQNERLARVVAEGCARFPAQAAARGWRDTVAEALARLRPESFFAAGPVAVPAVALAGEVPFAIRRTGARDPRFCRLAFAWPDRIAPEPAGEGRQLQVRQAVHHVNEVWAAEMAAACLFDFGRTAPHEFFDDAARWCFDEIRHCRMGYARLREWGFADEEIPLDSFSYDAGAETDALTRLGVIFFFESTYINTKSERTKLFAEMGDRLSSHDMDFDWADELIHTHYGKRWVEAFLAEEGGRRTPAEVKEQARQAVLRAQARATPDDRAATAAIFRQALTRISALPRAASF